MKFLAVLIALVAYKARWGVDSVQDDTWFQRWAARVVGWQLVPWMGLALAVLVPVLIAIGVLGAVEDLLFGLPWIAVAAVLMLYSLGRGDLEQLQDRYRSQCQNGDFEAAQLSTLPALGVASAENVDSAEDVHRAVQQAFYYHAYQRWFAVLFYFVLAGPVAALAYRLLQLCRQQFEPALVERVLLLVDWLPARLLAATFAVAGDLVRSRTLLVDMVFRASEPIDALLYAVGSAASFPADESADESFEIRAVAQHSEGVALLSRSAIAWVGVLAFLVLLV